MVCATGCPQSPQTLYYIILYYIYFMASGVKSGVYCYLHCIYIYIYIYIPPPHSASYNIAATITCASRVSVLVGHRKRPPPVQVAVATTTCASRVSALADHRKRPPVQVTVAPDQHTHHSHHHMCQKVNALNGRRKRPPAQVTAGQNLHRRHWSACCSKQM